MTNSFISLKKKISFNGKWTKSLTSQPCKVFNLVSELLLHCCNPLSQPQKKPLAMTSPLYTLPSPPQLQQPQAAFCISDFTSSGKFMRVEQKRMCPFMCDSSVTLERVSNDLS